METQEAITETAIEKTVCIPMRDAKRYPMSPEVTEFLLNVMLGEMKTLSEKDKPFLYSVIEKRVAFCFKYTVEPKLIVFLMMLSKSPGTAILYLWYLQMVSRDQKINHFTIGNFCEIFPVGFLSEDDLHKIWSSQKVSWKGSDNMVDHQEAGKSLF